MLDRTSRTKLVARMRGKGGFRVAAMIGAFIIALGLIIGFIVSGFVKTADFMPQVTRLATGGTAGLLSADLFFEGLLRNGKLIVIMWLLGFLPPCQNLNYVVIFIKAVSVALAASVVAGLGGKYVMCYMLMPNLILMPCLVAMLAQAERFAGLSKRRFSGAISRVVEKANDFGTYLFMLIICMAGTAAASLFEAYAAPLLFGVFS